MARQMHTACTKKEKKNKNKNKKQTGDKTFKLHTSFFGLNRSTTNDPPYGTHIKTISEI